MLLFYRSFGPKEDAFFRDVTELAAAEGLPLLYLAANSGARIGVAKEVQAAFRVGWVDAGRPNEGFQYLYLTDGDFEKFGSSVFAEKVKFYEFFSFRKFRLLEQFRPGRGLVLPKPFEWDPEALLLALDADRGWWARVSRVYIKGLQNPAQI